jgi:hypothetical protein
MFLTLDPAHPEERVARLFSPGPLARHDLPERVDAYSGEKQLAPYASSCFLADVIEGVNARALDSAKPNAPIPGQRLEQEVLCEHLVAVAGVDSAVESNDERLLRAEDSLIILVARQPLSPRQEVINRDGKLSLQ